MIGLLFSKGAAYKVWVAGHFIYCVFLAAVVKYLCKIDKSEICRCVKNDKSRLEA
jgi:hypothetical protein